MSIRLMTKVWDSALPTDEKFVALALADWASDDGSNIFASQAHMAWKVGKTDRAVRDTLAKLISRGVLVPVGKKWSSQGSTGATVEYRLDTDKMPVRNPFESPYKSDGNTFRPDSKTGSRPEVCDISPGSLRHLARKPTSDDPLEDPLVDPLEVGTAQVQQGFFDEERRERITVFREFLADSFRGRRGNATNRIRLQNLVERGATMEQLKNAVAVTKKRTDLKDDFSFCIGVLARFVEEGVDGSDDVRGASTGRSGYAGARPYAGAPGARRMAGQRQGSGSPVLDEYRKAF